MATFKEDNQTSHLGEAINDKVSELGIESNGVDFIERRSPHSIYYRVGIYVDPVEGYGPDDVLEITVRVQK